ncbi:hypothetical protein MBLNU457_5799t2 [Dothideomycetes sp. NU457]
MAVLQVSLSPEATARVHDLLLCLAKFGETVCIEARNDKLSFTTLNSSRTAYASFALEASSFFTTYEFNSLTSTAEGRFTCQLYNRALLSAFKARLFDPRNRDSPIDRCDLTIDEQPDKVECRLIVKMVCRHGITKTYKLTYESVEIMHALFDRSAAPNGWKITSRILREYIEYFGPKTEQLDMLAKEGKAIFTSFTEKVMDGKEILKQPLETAVSIHIDDFENFHAEEDMHVVISVKDFKAIVTHAETLRTPVIAAFSRPSRPLQFSYQTLGMHCEFILMTSGDYRGTATSSTPKSVTTRPSTRQSSAMPSTRQTSALPSQGPAPTTTNTDMPPPPKPMSTISQIQRKPLSGLNRGISLTAPSQDSDSLFVPNDADGDRRWDEPDYDNEEAEDMLGWDANDSAE